MEEARHCTNKAWNGVSLGTGAAWTSRRVRLLYSSAETLPPLPSERLYLILNLAAFATARERLAMGFASLHHALQPCSVCERLLAIKVDAQGEIESSGTCYGNQCYYRGYCDCTRQVQLALHGPHWHPHVIHPSCHEHQI